MTKALEDLLKMEPEEILKYNERPTADQIRNKQQIYYEDVDEGMELPKYIYHPTPTHLFRWSAAIENFHRIHYDLDFGMNHDRNPSIGDKIFFQHRYSDIRERVGRDGKPFLIVTNETTYTNQNNEVLCITRASSIRR